MLQSSTSTAMLNTSTSANKNGSQNQAMQRRMAVTFFGLLAHRSPVPADQSRGRHCRSLRNLEPTMLRRELEILMQVPDEST